MKTIKKIQPKTQFEKGDGGISYAMYFIAIIITLVLFVFFKFDADSYMIEQTLENGLHIAETAILTSSQDEIVGTYRTADYEKEINRLHIVSKYDETSAAKDPVEEAQVNLIGRKFSTLIQEQLKLDGSVPTTDILKIMCGPTSQIQIVSATIYEPIYTKSVSKTENGTINSPGLIEGSANLKKYDFSIDYSIIGWIQYNLVYNPNTNDYLYFDKFVLSDTPELKNGRIVEGSTIEATLTTEFNGVRNIFAGINTHDGSSIFSSSPTQSKYSIEVTQSADVTLISLDSRQQ